MFEIKTEKCSCCEDQTHLVKMDIGFLANLTKDDLVITLNDEELLELRGWLELEVKQTINPDDYHYIEVDGELVDINEYEKAFASSPDEK